MMSNPFADPEYLVDYGLKGKDIELREAPKGTGQPPQSPLASPPSVISSYRDLEFEPVAPRQQNGLSKVLYTFDNSLERLRGAGFERHALPCEAFALIIDGLEGKLSASAQAIKQDMFTSAGEWLSLVFKPQGGILHCYEHPQNVVWVPGSNTYDCSCMTALNVLTFPLNGLTLRNHVPIRDVAAKSPDLVTYVWSRPFNQLPGELQNSPGLWIPGENVAWPVARVVFVSRYVVSYFSGASRGVRSAQKISTGNRGP